MYEKCANAYIAYEKDFVDAVLAGIDDVRVGNTVEHEEVLKRVNYLINSNNDS